MRTIYAFCILFLVFSGQALAQLKCTNCTVTPVNGAAIVGRPTSHATIPVENNAFAGSIQLDGDCEFIITGTGNYTLSGQITSAAGAAASLTFKAPDAGTLGKDAGITLSGDAANTYSGLTTLAGGYVICNKTNAVAIPNNLKIAAVSQSSFVHLWCKANGQLGNSVVDFSDAQTNSFLHLNGTTQTIAGLKSNNDKAVVENQEPDYRPASMANEQPTSEAILNIATGSIPCTFGGGAYIRRGTTTQPLTVNITGGTQIIQNPTDNVTNVTLTSAGESTLEFNTSTATTYSLGSSVTFKGNGTLKKTGPGVLAMTGTSVLKSGGQIWVAEGTLRNDGTNIYSNDTESNSATLRVEAASAGTTPIFDLWGNNSVFGGLTGNGMVQNNFGTAGTSPGGGYNELSLKLTGPYTFAGVIRDNSGNNVAPQSNGGEGKGGVALKSDGFQMQYLSGVNLYTGSTTVLVGTLQLTGEGKLGGGTYTGVLNVGGYFQHSGSATQIFAGDITNGGSLLLSSGKTIITGNKSFTGSIAVYGGFLGGTGNLNQMQTLDLWGSICAGDGVEGNGVTFAVNFLNIRSSTSKLIVTSKPDHTPSALNVAAMQTKLYGNSDKFIVDVLGGADLQSGRIIMASINYSNAFSIPILGVNNTGKPVTFRWVEGNVNDGNNGGLYMDISTKGLSCDNCSFPGPANTTTVGTPATPAFLLSGESGTFAGDITLNGNCNFSILGVGNYTLSGQIKSADGATTSLTFKAPAAGSAGNAAGITLSGEAANTYSGLTTLAGGYVICNKTNVVAIPNDLKIAAASANSVHLWCKANGQLGNAAVVDFSDAQAFSYLHLNGTTQTIGGLKSNNDKAVVENQEPDYRPASMANEQPTSEAILNIATGSIPCTFGGGAYIRRGTTTQPLTVNVTGGTQIIQNPVDRVNNVTLTSAGESTLEFNTATAATYSLGSGVTFKGNGILKKTGPGVLAMTSASVLKSGGQIWVAEGTLRNDGTNIYSNSTESNSATLRLEAATAGSTPIFDLWGNNSVFGGLTGSGVVQNNFGTAGTSPGGGYNELFIKLTGAYTFNGVIRDNSGNNVAPESNGGEGKGGVALKSEGNQAQRLALAGVNTYTGATRVSDGKLILTGDGKLGGGTYTGVLTTSGGGYFHHEGNATQIFSGDITSIVDAVGGLELLGGKTIITGAKSYNGNINLYGSAFLGGAGSLSNINFLNVSGSGSIGGGNGVEGYGATFALKILRFKSATSKLIVTSKTDNTPSVLNVTSMKSDEGEGSFIVDVLGGASLQSGCIISAQIADPTLYPTPVLGVNNTGKGVRLYWNNDGLQMQISHGTIALSTGSVCPKGTAAAGNSPITVTAAYSDVRDFPPITTVPSFTLSENTAKSSDIEISRDTNARTITAAFDGANPTNADLPYTITYDDHQYAAKSIETHINRLPVLSVGSGGNPTCVGTSLLLQGVAKDGTGRTISSQNTNLATVSSTTAALTATATTLAAGNAGFLLTDGDGCKSEPLVVEVKGIPAISPGSAGATLCATVNGTAGTTTLTADHDPATAPALAWAINSPATGASIEDVTQGDKEARFSVTNTAITEQKQFTVEYTDNTGCKGTSVITVNPNPTLLPVSPALCAAGPNDGDNTTLINASQDPASASPWVINSVATGASIEDVTQGDRQARFSVTNTTITEQKQFTVEYTGNAGCKGTTVITVNPVPVVSVRSGSGFDLAKLCAGAQYAEALTVSETIAGNWAVYRTGTTTASTISTGVTSSATAGRGNIQAGNTTAATAMVEDVVFISNASCRSTALPITIHPKPVMNSITNKAYCRDIDVSAFTPASAGTGEAAPTHYQWNVEANATHRDDINLADYTADWTKTAVSSFRTPGTTSVIKRDITIKGYNSTSGCVSESKVFTITVNPGLTLSYTSTSPICSGTDTYVFLNSSISDADFTWTVPANSLGAVSQTTPSATPAIKQSLTGSGTVTYTVRASSGSSNSCAATVEIPIVVSSSQAATATAAGGGSYCVNPDNATYQTNLSSSTTATNAEWVYTSYFPEGQAGGLISGNTQKWEKGALTAVTDNLVLSGQATASVYYVFRPFTDCLGSPSAPVSVGLYPALAAPVVENSTVCSSSTAHATTTNIVLSSTTADVVYTWAVDKANAPDVSGFSEPSRGGAAASTGNPTAATGGPVADHLTLAATATAAQTIVYRITPWHSGCPGKTASANVLVNPLPAANKPADRLYCSGAEVAAEPLTGTYEANSFKWSGGASAGLADQAVYGSGLPAYTAPASGQHIGPVEVKIAAKNAKGCESSSEVSFTLSVNVKPSLTLGTSRALCTGTTVETAAATKIGITPAAIKYKWKARAEGAGAADIKIIKDGTVRSFPFEENTLQEGDIIKKMTTPAGSVAIITFIARPFLAECAGDEVSTTVQVNGTDLTGGIANNSPGICSGNTANIKVGDAENGNTYTWASADISGKVQGYSQQTERRAATTISDALTLTGNKQSNVIYTITPSRGDCDGAVVSHTVFVNPVPVMTVSPATVTICSREKTAIILSTNLSDPESKGVTYSWQVTNNTLGALSSTANQAGFEQQKLVNDATAEAVVTYTFTSRYTTADGAIQCPSQTGTSVYTVRPRVVAGISEATAKACLGDEAITLKAIAPEGATYQWLKDGAPVQDATGNSFVVTTGSVSASMYVVKITNSSGCAVSDSRKVEVTEDAYFTGASAAMDKTEAEINKPVSFKYSGPNAGYSWNFGDNTPTVTDKETSHSYSNQGTYKPTLGVVKPNQTVCKRTFTLPDLKITPITGDLEGATAFSIYPVPAQDRLTIINESGDLQNITIYDISGKTVMSEAVNGNKAILSVAHLTNGIYLLTITGSKGVKHLKISKN